MQGTAGLLEDTPKMQLQTQKEDFRNTEHLLGRACCSVIHTWARAAIYAKRSGRGFCNNPAEIRQNLAFRLWEVTVEMEGSGGF